MRDNDVENVIKYFSGVDLLEKGLGKKKRAQTPWSPAEMELMWEKGCLGMDGPLQGNFTMWHCFCHNYGVRPVKEIRMIKYQDVQVKNE